jgi:hypothetical protein
MTNSLSVVSIAFARIGCVLVGILHPEMSSPGIADFIKVLIYDSPDFPHKAWRAAWVRCLHSSKNRAASLAPAVWSARTFPLYGYRKRQRTYSGFTANNGLRAVHRGAVRLLQSDASEFHREQRPARSPPGQSVSRRNRPPDLCFFAHGWRAMLVQLYLYMLGLGRQTNMSYFPQ